MTAQTRTDDELLARQLWAIGDIVRLRLLSFLPTDENCESGNNVSRLAEKLELSQPTVSHHRRGRRQAGPGRNRKMGRTSFTGSIRRRPTASAMPCVKRSRFAASVPPRPRPAPSPILKAQVKLDLPVPPGTL